MTFMASIVLFFLSYLEHTRSVRPSTILSLYLSLTVILDIAQLRSLWLQLGTQGITGIFTASFVAKLVAFILEATNKRSTLRPIYKDLAPEESGGIIIAASLYGLISSSGVVIKGLSI